MNIPQQKLHLAVYAAFSLAAFVILADFVLPGSIFNDAIVKVQKERQQYYNAARNYHYSYKVITSEHQFLVTEDFAGSELLNKNIEYSVSPLFKEVNWYRLRSSDNRSYYSLRLASGLVLPVLTLLSIFVAFRYKKRYGTLILQILLIGDLILLLT